MKYNKFSEMAKNAWFKYLNSPIFGTKNKGNRSVVDFLAGFNSALPLDTITRFEVIGGFGDRLIVRNDVKLEVSVQDDNRTLKIFIVSDGAKGE